jgi:hypothetical protein
VWQSNLFAVESYVNAVNLFSSSQWKHGMHFSRSYGFGCHFIIFRQSSSGRLHKQKSGERHLVDHRLWL